MEKQRFIFDLDGTLWMPDFSYEEQYFKSVLNGDDAERLISMLPKLIEDYERTQTNYNIEVLSNFFTNNSGILIGNEIVEGWLRAYEDVEPKVIEGVFESLDYLRCNDRSMVILTNWFLKPQIVGLKKCGLLDYFDEIYGGEHILKPHVDSYRIACGRYPVEECIMIGDSLDNDVYGPMEVGVDAIYYNSNNQDDFDKKKIKSIGSMRTIKELF